MRKWFRILTRIELVLIFLVIIAGSVVRMTGSGMGCPDWPKCFGYLIPPTEQSQIEWEAQRAYNKGQIIIVDETLMVAKKELITGDHYDAENWEAYTKHDYAIFNAAHTWTEYINRLLGALSGVPMLILLFSGIWYVRKDWRLLALSIVGMILLGFEAWLGKLVVDGNLIPGSITIHMMGALSVVAVLLLMLGINTDFKNKTVPRSVRAILILVLLMTLVQIIIGTQVREQVDVLYKEQIARGNWIESLNWQFYFHRSFSLLLLASASWLWWQNRIKQLHIQEINPLMLIIIIEVLLGVILAYLNMPKIAQPLHLLLGAVLLSLEIFALIRISASKRRTKDITE